MSRLRPLFALAVVFALPIYGQQAPSLWSPTWQRTNSTEPDWTTGQNVNYGGILFPHVHVQSVYGSSTSDGLGVGHHDPQRDGWTIQGIELGLSSRVGEHFQTFTNMHLSYDRESGDWSHEFEEAFVKVTALPGGFELRGGRFFNRVGLQNALHLHGWDWLDQSLMIGRFLGEDGLSTIGGEVNWTLPVNWTSLLTASVGRAPTHEEHDEHEEEAPGFEDGLLAFNWTNQFYYNDFHQFRAGLLAVLGEEHGMKLYGVHAEYLWRENGFDLGGRSFRWRTEAMLRRFDGGRGQTLDEVGLYTDLRYGFNPRVEAGVRFDYVSGVPEVGLEKRMRVSPGVSFFLNPVRTTSLRLQYNYDRLDNRVEEHGLWLQLGFNWGGPEVR